MKKLQTPWDSDELLMVDIGCFERGCAMVAGDWAAGERPECRATVDAEAYERLRAAGQNAINTLFLIRDGATGLWGDDLARCNNALEHLIEDFTEQPVADCKEGDKLSPPSPTLAVHVGYRYQSPVGGWEYGDHIPAGFDTQKWAHQKIYILQEQA